jgi:hypothetical protein
MFSATAFLFQRSYILCGKNVQNVSRQTGKSLVVFDRVVFELQLAVLTPEAALSLDSEGRILARRIEIYFFHLADAGKARAGGQVALEGLNIIRLTFG